MLSNLDRLAMRKARAAHRSRRGAYAVARRLGRVVPVGFAAPSWAEGLSPAMPSSDPVGDYIASQFAHLSTIEE